VNVHQVTANESGQFARTLSAEEIAAAEADTVVIPAVKDTSSRVDVPGNVSASENATRISDNPKDIAARDKVPLQLIPPCAERLTALAIAHGSRTKGYGDWNWRDKGICLLTYAGAIMRHCNAIRDGQDIDPESRLPHLAHIAAGAMILMDATEHGKLIDDRPGA
jgi:hypothetical protein